MEMESDYHRYDDEQAEGEDIFSQEKTILSLLALEQEEEAKEWKSRYDTLKASAINVGIPIDDEISTDPRAKSTTHGVSDISKSIRNFLKYQTVLDFSDQSIGRKGFYLIMKVLHRLKLKKEYLLLLRNCGLSDDICGDEAGKLITFSGMEALDLSNNNLGDLYSESISKNIRVRSHKLIAEKFQMIMIIASARPTSVHRDSWKSSIIEIEVFRIIYD